MACNSSYPPVLDEDTCDKMRSAYPTCAQLINQCYKSQSASNCVRAEACCNEGPMNSYDLTGRNVYDVRQKCKGDLCYPILHSIDKYLNREEVKRKLGVKPNIRHQICNYDIRNRFAITGDGSV